MNMTRLTPALALILLLAACGQPAEKSEPPPPAAPAPADATPSEPAPAPAAAEKLPAIALDMEGLRLVSESGSTALLAFDRAQVDTINVLSRAIGAEPKTSTNAECGAGPTQFAEWDNGLSALFMDGKFVGWSFDGPGALTTMNGVGVGSTRSALVQAFPELKVEQSTLGVEFTAGDYSGILSADGPNGKVETIWAGTSCVFR